MSDTPTPVATKGLAAEIAAQEQFERAKREIARNLSIREGFRLGTLTFEQFRTLPKSTQRAYAARWGTPDSPESRRTKARQKSKAKRARKLASQSKRRNRR